MTKESIIQTDQVLNKQQLGALEAMLELIIPASDDGTMPGAKDVGFQEYLLENAVDFIPELKEGLNAVIEGSQQIQKSEFQSLEEADQLSLIESLRGELGHFLRKLTHKVMSCYYIHDRVLEGLGLEARPPFPDGNQVDPGDLSLLDPVIQRGKIWRDA